MLTVFAAGELMESVASDEGSVDGRHFAGLSRISTRFASEVNLWQVRCLEGSGCESKGGVNPFI